jgi:hypothetical protein
LGKNKYVLVDVKCANSTVSSNCALDKSFVVYECVKGFRFVNNQDITRSVCTKNGWSKVPKCIEGKNEFNS